MNRYFGKWLAIVLFVILATSQLMAYAGQTEKLASASLFRPFPGLEINTVTELSKAGWLRYVVISVDTSFESLYVGPFNAGDNMDVPATVKETLEANGLLAAVNGDFFDSTSFMPLSMVVSKSSLVRSPRKDADFATLCLIKGATAYIEKFSWSAKLIRSNGIVLNISSYNELSVGSSEIVLYNALRTDRKYPGKATVVLLKGNVALGKFHTGATGVPDEPGALLLPFEYEVVATGEKAKQLDGLAAGEEVRLEFSLFPPYPMESAFSGKPILVQNGLKVGSLSRFTSISSNQKAPRTMAGITWEGKLLLVAVEGRSEDSNGLTLEEAAQLMLDLGCRDALNLDGGGSTQAVASDGITSHRLIVPSGTERKVSFAVGVASRYGDNARTSPSITALPAFGPSFEIPDVGRIAEPGSSYAGMIRELPVVVVGTKLYFTTEAGANPAILIKHGHVSASLDNMGFIVDSAGLIELEATIEDKVVSYMLLAADKPSEVHLVSATMLEGGLNLALKAYDSSGRMIPATAVGLNLIINGGLGQFEVSAPLIPAKILAEAGQIGNILVFYGNTQLMALMAGAGFIQTGQTEVLLSHLDNPESWTAYATSSTAGNSIQAVMGEGRSSIALSYDFTGSGVRASYLKPLDVITLPQGATALSIMANGDKAGGHWLRANVRDALDIRYFLDFGRLSGAGWRYYSAVLPENLGSLTLEQIYLVEFKDEMISSGTVLLDDLYAVMGRSQESGVVLEQFAEDPALKGYYGIESVSLPVGLGIIADYGLLAAPGNIVICRIDATDGTGYRNGIGQWQVLYDACTNPGKSGTLVIEVTGLKQKAKTGSAPLASMQDANERELLIAAAQRALYMGYSEVAIIERSSQERLAMTREGVIYLALP